MAPGGPDAETLQDLCCGLACSAVRHPVGKPVVVLDPSGGAGSAPPLEFLDDKCSIRLVRAASAKALRSYVAWAGRHSSDLNVLFVTKGSSLASFASMGIRARPPGWGIVDDLLKNPLEEIFDD